MGVEGWTRGRHAEGELVMEMPMSGDTFSLSWWGRNSGGTVTGEGGGERDLEWDGTALHIVYGFAFEAEQAGVRERARW